MSRLLIDILSLEGFGHVCWPVLDAGGNNIAPVPMSCGPDRKQKMIWMVAAANSNKGLTTSPMVAYPEHICKMLAAHVLRGFTLRRTFASPGGGKVFGQEGALPSSRPYSHACFFLLNLSARAKLP